MASVNFLTARVLLDKYPSEKLRLFPTQQQLFDFIDADGSSMRCDDKWRPFSIELDSVASVMKYREERGQSLCALLEGIPSVFVRPGKRERSCDSTGSGGAGDEPVPLGALRYSSQQRFFVALRTSYLYEFHCSIPLGQQHLYEIIRENEPCHFYIDAEQESEYTITDEYTRLCASGAASAAPPPHLGVSCCVWDCPHRPRHDRTTELLLEHLDIYLSLREDLNLTLKGASIVVLRSVPLNCCSSNTGTSSVGAEGFGKFSQHYVIRFANGVMFSDNRSVGVLVRDFVAWLAEVAARNLDVHCNLFYHGEPKVSSVKQFDEGIVQVSLSDSNTSACTSRPSLFLPLRCVIDASVYSRNRMFRCYGSTKLGKTAVLMLDVFCAASSAVVVEPAASEADFLRSLVCYPHDEPPSTLIRLGEADQRSITSHNAAFTSRGCAGVGMARVPSPWPGIDGFVNNLLASLPTAVKGRVTHYRCIYAEEPSDNSVADSVVSIIYHVENSRFCHNVQREHKSNGVYYVASLLHRHVVQKCFDPDCRHFRSAPTAFSDTLCCSVAQQSSLCSEPFFVVDNSQALQHCAALRTPVILL